MQTPLEDDFSTGMRHVQSTRLSYYFLFNMSINMLFNARIGMIKRENIER